MSQRIDTDPDGIPRPPLSPRMRTETPAPPIDPSPGVRIAQQVREGVTDLGGLALAGYLATRQLVPGTWALGFVLVLLLPSPVLVKIAKIVAARQGHSGAVAIGAGAVAIGACS